MSFEDTWRLVDLAKEVIKELKAIRKHLEIMNDRERLRDINRGI